MKDKKLILTIGGFIVFLGIVYMAYSGLAKNYQGTAKGNSTESQDGRSKAPDVTVYDKDLNPVKLSDYKGTPVVLNFWATWCGYCKKEMPDFQRAVEKYSEEDVKILMINITDGKGETKETALEYIEKNNYTMEVLLDLDLEVAKAYSISGIPRTVFIDKEGNIKLDRVGMIDSETLNNLIEELINE